MCFFDMARSATRAARKCTDTHPIRSVAFHPGGDVLLAATAHVALHLYDVATFRCFLSPVEVWHIRLLFAAPLASAPIPHAHA